MQIDATRHLIGDMGRVNVIRCGLSHTFVQFKINNSDIIATLFNTIEILFYTVSYLHCCFVLHHCWRAT
jgi:hypothetical protein